MDTAYLKKHLGECLVDVMSEVSEKRPRDPIEYIAHWLYNYQSNKSYEENQRRESVQLEKEIKMRDDEKALKEQRKEEAIKIAAEEEAKKKLEEELAQKASESASKLAPVLETQEPEEEAGRSQGETTTVATSEEAPQEAAPQEAAPQEATEPPAQEHEADEPPANTEQAEAIAAAEESVEGAEQEPEPETESST